MSENRIRQLRIERKLKQGQLGDNLGISQQTVSRIEKDKTTMSIDTLERLSKYFNVTADYILGLSDYRRNIDDRSFKEKKEYDEFHEFYHIYKRLSERDRKLLNCLGKDMNEIK